jgi:hypothetical protein
LRERLQNGIGRVGEMVVLLASRGKLLNLCATKNNMMKKERNDVWDTIEMCVGFSLILSQGK